MGLCSGIGHQHASHDVVYAILRCNTVTVDLESMPCENFSSKYETSGTSHELLNWVTRRLVWGDSLDKIIHFYPKPVWFWHLTPPFTFGGFRLHFLCSHSSSPFRTFTRTTPNPLWPVKSFNVYTGPTHVQLSMQWITLPLALYSLPRSWAAHKLAKNWKQRKIQCKVVQVGVSCVAYLLCYFLWLHTPYICLFTDPSFQLVLTTTLFPIHYNESNAISWSLPLLCCLWARGMCRLCGTASRCMFIFFGESCKKTSD
jgi:hypothetical protein